MAMIGEDRSGMDGSVHFKRPAACSESERREFARLVREGFRGSDESLPGRIELSKSLAFYYGTDESLGAIAGLKAPGGGHRRRLFEKASLSESPDAFGVELGWVYVTPASRRRGVAGKLCRGLLASASDEGVFATTRPDNAPMIRLLRALGFERAGRPFPRRDEMLSVYLRPGRGDGGTAPAGGAVGE
jgi:ribosomal protein S18 acetylase RimI-like enzyme